MVTEKDLENELNKPDVNFSLDENQLSFINECKKKGLSGCSLTIDNNQVWVSFNNNFLK